MGVSGSKRGGSGPAEVSSRAEATPNGACMSWLELAVWSGSAWGISGKLDCVSSNSAWRMSAGPSGESDLSVDAIFGLDRERIDVNLDY